jgi:hypothetical protein
MALSNHTAGNEVIGAIIGLVYALVQVATGHASQQDAFFLGGYILGGVGFLGLVGFISGVVADLIHARSKAGSAPSPERAVSAAEPVSAPSHGNFIVHHWRGELPLWVSYWVINFLGNLCAVAIPILIAAIFASKSGYYPLSVFATLLGTWACILVLVCWQLVGCPSRKSYPRVAMMQSGQDWCGDDGPRSLYGSS